jgi:hypothetical protein
LVLSAELSPDQKVMMFTRLVISSKFDRRIGVIVCYRPFDISISHRFIILSVWIQFVLSCWRKVHGIFAIILAEVKIGVHVVLIDQEVEKNEKEFGQIMNERKILRLGIPE